MKNIWSLSMLLISAVLLGCGGGGGGSNSDISGGNPSAYVWPTGSAPLTVATSSYENKNAAQLVRTQLEKFDPNVSSVSVTFGDFFQDGQFSAFIVVNQSGTNGKVYFLRWKTATSAWVDDTDRILASTERSACVSSQYAITADFNGDQKPDVYLSCASSQQPVAQLLFLSQSGGSYRKKTSEIVVDGKSAAALDINGDGKLDLIASHVTSTTRGEPQVYFGDGLGGFSFQTRGSALVAQDTQNNCGGDSIPASIDSVSVVPSTSGRFDLILGSTGASNSIVWLKDLSPSSSPRYSVCSSKAFPNLTDTARLTDVYSSVSNAATSFYLARKSSPEAMSITKFSLTETPGNGGLSTTYTLTKGLQPVVLNAAGGLPDLFKLNGSVFQAFDAGCSTQTIRCSSLSASLSAIN
jgi:hypothetical protein